MTRAPGDTMFFGRIAHAIAEAQNLYDVVIIDCPPQLGYLTLSALSAATAVLITVHPQMLDVLSMAQFLTMTGDLLEVVADAGGTTELRLDELSRDQIRAERWTAESDGRVSNALYLRIARADSPDAEKHGNLGRVDYESDAL